MTDTNDNPPMFELPVYSFDVPENAPRGYQVGVLLAQDPDVGENAIVTYTVLSDWGNDVFSLNPQTGVLTLTAHLDYEEVSSPPISLLKPKPNSFKLICRYSIIFWWCKRKITESPASRPL